MCPWHQAGFTVLVLFFPSTLTLPEFRVLLLQKAFLDIPAFGTAYVAAPCPGIPDPLHHETSHTQLSLTAAPSLEYP